MRPLPPLVASMLMLCGGVLFDFLCTCQCVMFVLPKSKGLGASERANTTLCRYLPRSNLTQRYPTKCRLCPHLSLSFSAAWWGSYHLAFTSQQSDCRIIAPVSTQSSALLPELLSGSREGESLINSIRSQEAKPSSLGLTTTCLRVPHTRACGSHQRRIPALPARPLLFALQSVLYFSFLLAR